MRLRSATQAIHDAYAVQLRGGGWDVMPRAPSQGSSDRMVSLVEAGYIISAVEKTPHAAWARFAYGPVEYGSDIELICQKIWEQFHPHVSGMSVPRQVKLMALPLLCAQNTRIANWGGEHTLSVADVCRISGLDASHWVRDWLKYWDLMRDVLEVWDSELLVKVADVVSGLRGESA